MSINPTLLQLARTKVAESLQMQKSAVVPPPPPAGDPSMMGGAPPMDPAMMGGAPPMDPSMMGAAPPMDPAMMGGAPPSAGAAPMAPPDPAAGAAMPPAAPAAPGMPAAAPPKMKPEDRINQVDFRLYNMQQQLTAIMNALNVDLPAGALVTPPGSPVPVAEAAVPGGTQDPSVAGGQQGGQDNGTGINPIEALQAFNPGGGSGGGGGGGAEKQAIDIAALLGNIVGRGITTDILKSAEEFPAQPQYQQPPVKPAARMQNNIAATAAILRSRIQSK